MPTHTKYRKYCKSCEDYKLFDFHKSELKCDSCNGEYEKVSFDEIDDTKILAQQSRYRRHEFDSLNNILFKRKNLMAELFSETKIGYEVIEDDAGFIEKQRKALAEYNEKRKERIKLQEKFANVGRNDVCLCGSGKKYKKCCLNDIEKIN